METIPLDTNPSEIPIEYNGNKYFPDLLARSFYSWVKLSDDFIRNPDSEKRIKFLLTVFLSENGIIKKRDYNLEEVRKIAEKIYNALLSVIPVFPQEEQEKMLRGARRFQRDEEIRAGQSYKDSDL